MKNETRSMLVKLTLSKNEQCSMLALKLLANETTIENEYKYAGGFMKAVLNGNYNDAITRADNENKIALTK